MLQYAILVICFLVLNEQVVNGCSSSEPATYRVLKKTDTGGKQLVVAVDENAKLFCRPNAPWKKCIWKPPRNGVRQLKCVFTKGPDNLVHCPSFPEIHFDKAASDKEQHNCAIIVESIKEWHGGDWKCEFELDLPEESETIYIKERVKLLARGYRYP